MGPSSVNDRSRVHRAIVERPGANAERLGNSLFGPSLIPAAARRPTERLSFSNELIRGRSQVRDHVPVCAGVYGWLNSEGTVVYIGKSKSLRHRLASYFANETTDPKMAKIRSQSTTLIWEAISHELLALVREQELINRLRPPLNVEGKPERRQPGFVCLSRGLAPTAFFARQIPSRAAHSFGPFAGRSQLSLAIVSLNYVFKLRDCPDKTRIDFSNQLRLFQLEHHAKCLRYELASCPAPCAGACSRDSYMQNVQRAVNFLNGHDLTAIDRLEIDMQNAADALAFERAAVLRDQLTDLNWLGRRIKQLAAARRKLNGIVVVPGFDHHQLWMVVKSGILRACVMRPASPSEAKKIRRIVAQIASSCDAALPQNHLETHLLLTLASWFRKNQIQCGPVVSFREFESQYGTQYGGCGSNPDVRSRISSTHSRACA